MLLTSLALQEHER